MAEKAVLVISFEAENLEHAVDTLEQVREGIKDIPGITVWIGIRDVADKVLDIFEL